MYHAYFGLKQEPFGVSPDSRFFYATEQHNESWATLYYAIQQRRGFALLVGSAGLGKTSVLARLVQSLAGKCEVAFLTHPYYERQTLIGSILRSFGVESEISSTQNHQLLLEYLKKQDLSGKNSVVILDEVQDLDYDTFEAIRMLSNFESSSGKLVQVVLAGQPRLAEVLSRNEYVQLRQRINAVSRLDPLNTRDVGEYMAHRLRVAGGSGALFSSAAIEMIANASCGIPRNVNTLCFQSLTLAFALEHRQVEVSEVEEVLQDLDLSRTIPTHQLRTATPFRSFSRHWFRRKS